MTTGASIKPAMSVHTPAFSPESDIIGDIIAITPAGSNNPAHITVKTISTGNNHAGRFVVRTSGDLTLMPVLSENILVVRAQA